MKNKLNILLSISALLVLASCSGKEDTATTTANPTPTAPTTGKVTPTPSTEGEANPTADNTESSIQEVNNPSTIQIGGKTVTIQFPGISSGGFTTMDGNSSINGATIKPAERLIVSGNRYSYVQFGQVLMDNGKIHSFARGKGNGSLTKNMPTTGVVDYKGESINNFVDGTALIKVDFADKSLTGKLSSVVSDFGGDINFSAKITGNQFKGDAAQETTKATVNGAFFGPDAAEIGGEFRGKILNGTFGAKK